MLGYCRKRGRASVDGGTPGTKERTYHDIQWVRRLSDTHSGPGLGTRKGVVPLWTNRHQGGLQLFSLFPKGCA